MANKEGKEMSKALVIFLISVLIVCVYWFIEGFVNEYKRLF